MLECKIARATGIEMCQLIRHIYCRENDLPVATSKVTFNSFSALEVKAGFAAGMRKKIGRMIFQDSCSISFL